MLYFLLAVKGQGAHPRASGVRRQAHLPRNVWRKRPPIALNLVGEGVHILPQVSADEEVEAFKQCHLRNGTQRNAAETADWPPAMVR